MVCFKPSSFLTGEMVTVAMILAQAAGIPLGGMVVADQDTQEETAHIGVTSPNKMVIVFKADTVVGTWTDDNKQVHTISRGDVVISHVQE